MPIVDLDVEGRPCNKACFRRNSDRHPATDLDRPAKRGDPDQQHRANDKICDRGSQEPAPFLKQGERFKAEDCLCVNRRTSQQGNRGDDGRERDANPSWPNRRSRVGRRLCLEFRPAIATELRLAVVMFPRFSIERRVGCRLPLAALGTPLLDRLAA